jgi:hypothetical protein
MHDRIVSVQKRVTVSAGGALAATDIECSFIGELLGIWLINSDLAVTGDVTIKDKKTGNTIWATSDIGNEGQISPLVTAQSIAGAALTAYVPPIVDGDMTITIANGGVSTSATFRFYIRQA